MRNNNCKHTGGKKAPHQVKHKANRTHEDIEVTEDFKTVLNILHNGEPVVLVHGKAGTGKSTLIRYLKRELKLNIVVLAPTGIAALNAGGQTIHSFCRFPPRLITHEYVHPYKKELCRNIDLVILDEISMVRVDLLDGLDQFLRMNGRDAGAPFGGVQILIIGDLFQLPPVVASVAESEFLKNTYGGVYFFYSRFFQKTACFIVELSRIFRQTDPLFIALLNQIRSGSVLAIPSLNHLCFRPTEIDSEAITLTCTNRSAEIINNKRLGDLSGSPHTFYAKITGKGFEENTRSPVPVELVLKVGAQVMLTRNDTSEEKWVNGSIGTISDFDKGKIWVRLHNGDFAGNRLHIEPETWESIKYQYDQLSGTINPEVIGTFTQYPLIPAWAITIHKAQGKTFDRAIIDLGRGAFESGQLYVALSRCRTLEGLRLSRPIKNEDVISDPVITLMDRFLRKK